MNSAQDPEGNAGDFKSRIIRLVFLSPLALGVVFVVSLLVVLFTARGIVPYILLPLHGGVFVSFVAWKLISRWQRTRKQQSTEGANVFNGEYLKNLTGLPAILAYESIEIATGGFSKEIGKGGFGAVYEGTLMDGTLVAVKCLLNESRQGWNVNSNCSRCADVDRDSNGRAVISQIRHRLSKHERRQPETVQHTRLNPLGPAFRRRNNPAIEPEKIWC